MSDHTDPTPIDSSEQFERGPRLPDFPSAVMLVGFEGGAVYTADQDGEFLLIMNESASLDALDEEDRVGIKGFNVLHFTTSSCRDKYIEKRGWSRSHDTNPPSPAMPKTLKQDWESALTEHFDREYSAHPLPERARFSKAKEYQCCSVGGTLIAWLEDYGPRLLQEREVLRHALEVESDPTIIFTSTVPGLVAAKEILDPRPASVFYFLEDDFTSFLSRHPDPTFQWHVVYSSYFTHQLDADTLARAVAKYKLRSTERFWLHRESSMLAPLFGRGGDHLWKWNGRKPTLLEESFNTWVS